MPYALPPFKRLFSPIPQSQDAFAFFFLFFRPWLLADAFRPPLETSGYFGTGELGDRVAFMDCFHNLRILIGYPPEDFLLKNFFDLRVRDHIACDDGSKPRESFREECPCCGSIP